MQPAEETKAVFEHAEWAADPDTLKVWIFVRQDLQMTVGKICSQTSHATLGLYKDMQVDEVDPVLFAQWSSMDFPQETLKATSYLDLLQAHETARTWGFCANICHDAGRT